LADGLTNIITQLERQKAAIDMALAALRDIGDAPVPDASAEAEPVARTARKRGMSPDGKKRLVAALKRRGASKKAAEKTPVASAPAPGRRKGAPLNRRFTQEGRGKKLTEGTMKARTVELLRKAAKPMQSGEVAKRMSIGSGHASVNLSQLRRDGFLSHTPEGYTVI
jgi:hypothetical protein